MVEDFDAWYVEARASLDPALTAWCGDAGLAADALDEAFVRAVERWEQVRTLTSPSGWVWQTATNVIRRRARRGQLEQRLLRRRSATREVGVAGPCGDDVDLRRALLTLTERQRTAVVLFYIADLPTKEIGDVMEIAVGTVSATLHQARRRLAEQLGVPPGDLDGDEVQSQGDRR
jgi:RNA polymerase sigma-70 factor (ECF subfamily)